MSKQLESKTCAFCHEILFEEDDIVVCPDCGAPYHRECFSRCGKCLFEEHHGTDLQYDALKKSQDEEPKREEAKTKSSAETICISCGRPSPAEHPFCPYCGSEKASKSNGFSPFTAPRFNTFGDINKNTILEDDVTAEEAASFIGIKAFRYLPKFVANKKFSWKWASFLVPQGWFAYRKMYGVMAITLAAFLLSIILMVPFYSELYAVISELPIASNNAEQNALIQQAVTTALQTAEPQAILLFMLGSLVDFGTMLFGGLFGERIYRSKVIKEVKKIKQTDSSEEINVLLARKGGSNLFLFVIVVFVISNSDYILDFLISLL